jgi:hypothetical protein
MMMFDLSEYFYSFLWIVSVREVFVYLKGFSWRHWVQTWIIYTRNMNLHKNNNHIDYFQVECLEKQEHGVEETVHYIMNVVTAAYRQNKNKPISCYKLVINPDSFGATIENIFHVSFLVKDGYVDFSLGMHICST